MSDHERSKARTEVLPRVLAARNNVMSVMAGAWPAGDTAERVLRSSVILLDQAAEWLEGDPA